MPNERKIYRVKAISEEDKISIRRRYLDGELIKELAIEYKVSGVTLIAAMRDIDPMIEICPRVYRIKDRHFSVIDTERKAYFLGLLYADGCNRENNVVVLSLGEPDQYLVEGLKEELGFGGPLRIINYADHSWKTTHRLELCNKRLSRDLYRLGCVYRKSLILRFPTEEQVPKHLLPHFVRGFFDGDGSIANNRRLEVSMMSSPDFCQGLKTYLETTLNIKAYLKKHHNGKNHVVATNLRASVLVLDHIYQDATIYMTRKRDRFKRFIQTYRHSKHNGGSYISNDLFNAKISHWQSIMGAV